MMELDQLCQRLPRALADALCSLDRAEAEKLEEIRIYAGENPELVLAGRRCWIPVSVAMDELLAALSAQALYSCERQMAEGYIPLPGGHRAGVCGRIIRESDGTRRMTDVCAVCIRVARRIEGVSLPVRRFLLDEHGGAQRVLVLGAPGSGKTTMLRDAALWLCEQGRCVAVADEREELFAGSKTHGRLSVLSGVSKAEAFSMLLRSMAPQVIIGDELGGDEDVQAVRDMVRCGVGLIVSAHARSMEEAAHRPAIRRMLFEEVFDWYILLGRRSSVRAIYDRKGNRWEETESGQLECGRGGDDRNQHSGFSAFGW